MKATALADPPAASGPHVGNWLCLPMASTRESVRTVNKRAGRYLHSPGAAVVLDPLVL